jgi:hypothetical protein
MMKTPSIATTVWCVRKKKRKGMHRLRVKLEDVRSTWADMDEITRKNKTGRIPAFCPDPQCPEHTTVAYVGACMIPNLLELVDD